MGRLAVLTKDIDSFNGRIMKLNQLMLDHKSDVSSVVKAIKNDYNCLAFFDAVELCQQPELYPYLFEKDKQPIFQDDPKSMKDLLSMVTSQALESEGGAAEIASIPGIYSFSELISYLRILRTTFENGDSPTVAIKFVNINHTISIAYDPKKRNWLLIDSEELLIKEGNADFDIASILLTGFETKTFIIYSTIYALNKDLQKTTTLLKKCFSSKDFQELHLLNHEKASSTTVKNESLLLLASDVGDKKMIDILLSLDADPNLTNDDGMSPLYAAAENGHTEIVQGLIGISAKVDLVDNEAHSPLYMAAKNGHIKIVEALIAANAELELTDDEGLSALDIAKKNGHIKIVALLSEAIKRKDEMR